MTLPAIEPQTRPIVIGGIYKNTSHWANDGYLLVYDIQDTIHTIVLDNNRCPASTICQTDGSILGQQVGFDIKYSPAYQALNDRYQYLNQINHSLLPLHDYLCESDKVVADSLIHSIRISIKSDLLAIEYARVSLKHNRTALSPESPYGLSPDRRVSITENG